MCFQQSEPAHTREIEREVMVGLANPSPPVTEIDLDDEVLDLLRKILAEARLTNHHLALITGSEMTADEMEA